MEKGLRLVPLLLFLMLPAVAGAAEKDAVNCKDHPLFPRMTGYYLAECEERSYKEVEFVESKEKEIKAAGRYYKGEYKLKKGVRPPSDLEVVRTYQHTVKSLGGAVHWEKIGEDSGKTHFRIPRKDRSYWGKVESEHGGEKYELVIVEKMEAPAEAQIDAQTMARDLMTEGRATLYGIFFDFNRAVIKPESEPMLKEIAKLLEQNPRLKLFVVGHTDNVGSIDYNLKLSTLRAKAVVTELTTKYKISPLRLKAYGLGYLAPAATNKTEEGRAKNRRVELVEQ